MANRLKLFREINAASLNKNAKSTNTTPEKCVQIFRVKQLAYIAITVFERANN